MNQTDIINGLRGTEIEKKRAAEYIRTVLTESDKRGCRDKVEAFVQNHPDAKIWGDVKELHTLDDFFARVLLEDQTQTTLPAATAPSAPVEVQTPLTAVHMPDDKDIAMLRRTIITSDVPDDKIRLMVILAQKYNLDPFKHEIWATKAGIFIGRDGFLTIAHRSGDIDGMKTDFACDEKGKLESATTTVWSKKMSHPVEFTAYLEEFGRGKNGPWLTMPRVMLQKCAEAHALRRAFGGNGLYDEAEFAEAPESQ